MLLLENSMEIAFVGSCKCLLLLFLYMSCIFYFLYFHCQFHSQSVTRQVLSAGTTHIFLAYVKVVEGNVYEQFFAHMLSYFPSNKLMERNCFLLLFFSKSQFSNLFTLLCCFIVIQLNWIPSFRDKMIKIRNQTQLKLSTPNLRMRFKMQLRLQGSFALDIFGKLSFFNSITARF